MGEPRDEAALREQHEHRDGTDDVGDGQVELEDVGAHSAPDRGLAQEQRGGDGERRRDACRREGDPQAQQQRRGERRVVEHRRVRVETQAVLADQRQVAKALGDTEGEAAEEQHDDHHERRAQEQPGSDDPGEAMRPPQGPRRHGPLLPHFWRTSSPAGVGRANPAGLELRVAVLGQHGVRRHLRGRRVVVELGLHVGRSLVRSIAG